MGKPASHCKQGSAGAGQRIRATRTHLLLTAAGVSLGLLALLPQAPALIWNYTESVPVGLYRIDHARQGKGDVVVVAPSGRVRDVLERYDVLPPGRLLLKQIAAASGDTVCRIGTSVTINDAPAAIARQTNRDGRALPAWSGCRALGDGEIFLLAPHPASFDGRYLGPVDATQIVGVAHPLFTLPPAREAL